MDFLKNQIKGILIISKVVVILGVTCCLSISSPSAFKIPYLLNLITHNFSRIHLLFKGRYLSIYNKVRRYWFSLIHVNYRFHWESCVTRNGVDENDKVLPIHMQIFFKILFSMKPKCNLAYHSALKMGH